MQPKIIPRVIRTQLGCVIQPYRKRQAPSIEENTGEYDKVYHKYIPYVGFMLPYKGTISYITYNRNYDVLARAFPNYTIETAPIIPPKDMRYKLTLQGVEALRPAQVEILTEIERLKPKHPSWFVNLQTNEGKTLLAVYLSIQLRYKTWVLCFSDEILNQWKDAFLTNTDINPDRIVRMDGKLVNAFFAGKKDPDDYDVFLSTPKLLDSLGRNRANYGYIGDLFELCGIGFMIYDEAFRNVSNIVKITSCANVKHQIYLSADFAQGSFKKEPMFKQVFRNTPVITPSEDLKRSLKYTKIAVLKYNTRPNEVEKLSINNRYGFSAEYYMDYQFKKRTIFEIIKYLIKSYYFRDQGAHRMLILFTNIKHVEQVYQFLRENYPGVKVGRYYAELPDAEKRDAKHNADLLVATYGSFSTGLNTDNIKYVVSCNQCNKVMDNQSAGRSRRLADGSDAIYIMLVDIGFPYCVKKLSKRLEYLAETKSKSDEMFQYTYNPDMHKGDDGNGVS